MANANQKAVQPMRMPKKRRSDVPRPCCPICLASLQSQQCCDYSECQKKNQTRSGLAQNQLGLRRLRDQHGEGSALPFTAKNFVGERNQHEREKHHKKKRVQCSKSPMMEGPRIPDSVSIAPDWST